MRAASSWAPVSASGSDASLNGFIRSGDAEREGHRLVAVAVALAFLLLLIRTAWLDDDAYITFRTVDNFLNGYGLRWNVVNRVQAYTHPLWMFAMTAAAAITGEVYFAALILSIIISITVVALVVGRVALTVPMALLAASVLALSKAFVDYSTSGLENPLTHLLLAAFFLVLTAPAQAPRRMFVLSLLAALLMVNRIDTGLLVLPALIVRAWQLGPFRSWRPLALGMIPIAAWEMFSVAYYGFPFPNTAYSKLQHGVAQPELLMQGLLYFLDSLANDPLTLLVIAAGLIAAAGSAIAGARPMAAGIMLYLAYIVWVGGDFMSGRFFTAPLLMAVMLLVRRDVPRFTREGILALAAVWAVGLATPRPTIFSGAAYGSDIEPARVIAATGITDERRYYYPQSGLLNVRRGVAMPNHKWLYMGFDLAARQVRVFWTDAAGFIGYAAGPSVYLVDRYGLGDPLIARLPADAPWRIGHFARTVPEGYIESIEAGHNRVRDPAVSEYYERLKVITEGPIWSAERWRAIVAMQAGRYDRLIASYGMVYKSPADLSQPRPDGTDWNLESNAVLTPRGLHVQLMEPTRGQTVELSVSRNDRYQVVLYLGGRAVHDSSIEQRMQSDSSLITHTIPVPGGVTFDAVRVRPSEGDARYAVGHLRLLP
jgi:arabinofuranosyltransferase